MDYFKHPFASNSKLTQFGMELGLFREMETTPDQTHENFRFGTLFDLWETEKEKLDFLHGEMIGTDYTFDKKDIEKVKRMSTSLHKNEKYKIILSLNPNFQKEIFEERFSLDGVNYIGFKAKLDLFLKGLVIDLKTTNATGQNQFESACEMFGYYRQMCFYMALTGAKKSMIIGISKINHKVFVVNFSVDHPLYLETLEMCKLLIFKWNFLKD